jgi:hypothetical protein
MCGPRTPMDPPLSNPSACSQLATSRSRPPSIRTDNAVWCHPRHRLLRPTSAVLANRLWWGEQLGTSRMGCSGGGLRAAEERLGTRNPACAGSETPEAAHARRHATCARVRVGGYALRVDGVRHGETQRVCVVGGLENIIKNLMGFERNHQAPLDGFQLICTLGRLPVVAEPKKAHLMFLITLYKKYYMHFV